MIHVAAAYEMIGRMRFVKVAVVQAGGILFDAEAAIAKAERLLAEASGAELVVFPEAFIGGYPKGQDFGARVGGKNQHFIHHRWGSKLAGHARQ